MPYQHINQTIKQKGISLLEMMLVMVLFSILTVASILYYQSIQRNKKVNSAIELIQQLILAIDNYRHPMQYKIIDGVPQASDDDQTTADRQYYEGLDANLVAHSGFVPGQFLIEATSGKVSLHGGKATLQIITPWYTDKNKSLVTIKPTGTNLMAYQIQMSPIPNYACKTLKPRLETMRDSNAHCDERKYESVTCDGSGNNYNLTLETYPAGRLYCPNPEDSNNE